MYTGASSISGQAQPSLGDDVALDFGRSACDGAAERPDVAFEPARPVEIEVERRVRTGETGMCEAVDSCCAQRIFGCELRGLRAEQFELRQCGRILVASRSA